MKATYRGFERHLIFILYDTKEPPVRQLFSLKSPVSFGFGTPQGVKTALSPKFPHPYELAPGTTAIKKAPRGIVSPWGLFYGLIFTRDSGCEDALARPLLVVGLHRAGCRQRRTDL